MMENMNFGQMQFGKQMMDFYKSAFDNALNTMTMMQEQNENMVKMFLAQATWMPEQGKKPVMDWIEAVKKGREDFKKAATDNYKKVEEFFAASTKTK